jgi:hypothetical protein
MNDQVGTQGELLQPNHLSSRQYSYHFILLSDHFVNLGTELHVSRWFNCVHNLFTTSEILDHEIVLSVLNFTDVMLVLQ